jgi:hypothetical protein
MKHVRVPVTLTLTGPILTQASAPGALGIDSPVARDGEKRVYLPFSLVKGRIRQSWYELRPDGEATDGDDWFGRPSNVGDWSPGRGRFRFSDFVAAQGDPNGRTHRIRLDSKTGAADEGALQFIESPFAPGKNVQFRGEVRWFSGGGDGSDADRGDPYEELKRAFLWTSSYGAERTTGFGRVAAVDVGTRVVTPLAELSSSKAAAPAVVGIAIEMLDPFCVARRRVAHNLFESEDVISGAVLRGVLATAFNESIGRHGSAAIDEGVPRWKKLGKAFNAIRFSHALPVRVPACVDDAGLVAKRPVVPPLSLVQDHEGHWWDAALAEKPFVFRFDREDGGTGYRAPAFSIDWKDSGAVDAFFGVQCPGRELRVRTAIDWKERRAQKEQLFAYEMIVPKGFRWMAAADLSAVAETERAQVLAELDALLSISRDTAGERALPGLGKTKAKGRWTLAHPAAGEAASAEAARFEVSNVEVMLRPQVPSSLEPIAGNLWVITLQTPALLCDPETLNETSGPDALHAAYATVWEQLSDGKLTLVRYFARQSLAGGEYLQQRFTAGGKQSVPYRPFLLTDAGSVFVLRDKAGDARGLVEAWLAAGLPLPAWAVGRHDTTWKTNPFLPIDGFGAIAVNLECHEKKRPLPSAIAEVGGA